MMYLHSIIINIHRILYIIKLSRMRTFLSQKTTASKVSNRSPTRSPPRQQSPSQSQKQKHDKFAKQTSKLKPNINTQKVYNERNTDKNKSNKALIVKNYSQSSQSYEINLIPINIIFVGNTQISQENQNTVKFMFLNLFQTVDHNKIVSEEKSNEIKAQKRNYAKEIFVTQSHIRITPQSKQKEFSASHYTEYNEKSQNHGSSQLSIDNIVSHVLNIYKKSSILEQSLVKSLKISNFILEFRINLILSTQQIEKNQYNYHINTWRSLNGPKFFIFMYHCSNQDEVQLFHKFIKDVQYLYREDAVNIEKIKSINKIESQLDLSRKQESSESQNDLVSGIIVADCTVNKQNYKNIKEWVSLDDGIKLAQKYNLLYMQMSTNEKQNKLNKIIKAENKNKYLNILIALGFIKINQIGLEQVAEYNYNSLHYQLEKYKVTNTQNIQKQDNLLQELYSKSTDTILNVLNTTQQISIKIQQLLKYPHLIHNQAINYIPPTSLPQTYANFNTLSSTLQKYTQNKIQVLENIQILSILYNKLSKYQQQQKNKQQFGSFCSDMNINNSKIENKHKLCLNKIYSIIRIHVENILQEQKINQNDRRLQFIDEQNYLVMAIDRLIDRMVVRQQQISNKKSSVYDQFSNKVREIKVKMQNQLISNMNNLVHQNDTSQKIQSYILQTKIYELSMSGSTSISYKSQTLSENFNHLIQLLNAADKCNKVYCEKIGELIEKIEWQVNTKLFIFDRIVQLYTYNVVILRQIKQYLNKKMDNNISMRNQQQLMRVQQSEKELNQFLMQYYLNNYHQSLLNKKQLPLRKDTNRQKISSAIVFTREDIFSSEMVDQQKKKQDNIIEQQNCESKQNMKQQECQWHFEYNKKIIWKIQQQRAEYIQKVVQILSSLYNNPIKSKQTKYIELQHMKHIFANTKSVRTSQLTFLIEQQKNKTKKQEEKQKPILMSKKTDKSKQKFKNKTQNSSNSLAGIYGVGVKSQNLHFGTSRVSDNRGNIQKIQQTPNKVQVTNKIDEMEQFEEYGIQQLF